MQTLKEQVSEFMHMCCQRVEESPTIPSDEVVRLRARLVAEEFFEMLRAIYCRFSDRVHMRQLQEYVYNQIEQGTIGDGVGGSVDIVELADALGDLDYVIEGTRLAFGIDGEPIADAIHASNMAKRIGGYEDEHGKWRKPADWKAPDILGELRKQGWAG